MKHRIALVGVVLSLWATASHADATPDDAARVLAAGAHALDRGAVREAIEAYDAFADRGGHDPDVSYSRGVAYIARARTGDERPGDLGRAAAAFEETLALRSGDTDARVAVEAVRAEVARRRARGGEPIEVDESPDALRSLVSLASENTWALLAALGSAALTLGLVVRRAKAAAIRLASGVACAVGASAMVLFGGGAYLARWHRETVSNAVVVTPEARLLDVHGGSVGGRSIPEAARVEVLERRGGLARVRWGKDEGWTQTTNLFAIRNE